MTASEKTALMCEMYECQLKYLRTKMYAARRAYNSAAISHLAAEIAEVKSLMEAI